ncbi:DUF2256 domain-containing protein [Flavobacterium luminosum]
MKSHFLGERNGKKNWEEVKYCSDACRKRK